MVNNDFHPLLCLIYLPHLGRILFTVKSGSVYYDYASFLEQLALVSEVNNNLINA